MEELTGEVIEVPAVMDDSVIALARRAEERIDAVNKIKRVTLAVTNEHDWIDQSGKPYLVVSGAEKVAQLFGISWRFDIPAVEYLEDGHYNVTIKGYFSLGARSIEVMGTRSSRDPLFSKKGEEQVRPADVDKNDVMKAALTNCIGNGITRILGIRNLTWEDVKGAGIDTAKTAKVKYGVSEEKVAELRTRIHDMCLEMAGDEKTAQDLLEEISAWDTKEGAHKPGKRFAADLTDKQTPVVYGKVEDAFNAWLDEQAAAQ